MNPDEISGLFDGLAALVTAVGVFVAVVIGYLNRRAAAAAKVEATNAKDAAREAAARLIVVEGAVVEVGVRIDGRLTELLESETGRARAEGVAQGEQEQRDRNGIQGEGPGGG